MLQKNFKSEATIRPTGSQYFPSVGLANVLLLVSSLALEWPCWAPFLCADLPCLSLFKDVSLVKLWDFVTNLFFPRATLEILSCFFFQDMVSCSTRLSQAFYVAKAGFELLILQILLLNGFKDKCTLTTPAQTSVGLSTRVHQTLRSLLPASCPFIW